MRDTLFITYIIRVTGIYLAANEAFVEEIQRLRALLDMSTYQLEATRVNRNSLSNLLSEYYTLVQRLLLYSLEASEEGQSSEYYRQALLNIAEILRGIEPHE